MVQPNAWVHYLMSWFPERMATGGGWLPKKIKDQDIYWDLDGSLTGEPDTYTTWADASGGPDRQFGQPSDFFQRRVCPEFQILEVTYPIPAFLKVGYVCSLEGISPALNMATFWGIYVKFSGGIHIVILETNVTSPIRYRLINTWNLELKILELLKQKYSKDRLLNLAMSPIYKIDFSRKKSQKHQLFHSSPLPVLEMRFNLQHPGCNYTQVLFNQTGEDTFEENTWCAGGSHPTDPTAGRKCCDRKRFQQKGTQYSISPGSMGLVYLPKWMVDFYGKCSCIWSRFGRPPPPPPMYVPILTPFPSPPCGCGWLFLWVGNVALVLAFPHHDRCGVMIIISHIWFQWIRLKVSPHHSMVEHGCVKP